MVPQAADIAFLDATSGLDRTDCKVFRVLCPSPAGGLPEGLIITSSERDEVLTEALEFFETNVLQATLSKEEVQTGLGYG